MTTKRLYRSTTNKMIGGVCAGFSEYFNIDPTIVRIILVALALGCGFGVLFYLLCWIIIPQKPVSDNY